MAYWKKNKSIFFSVFFSSGYFMLFISFEKMWSGVLATCMKKPTKTRVRFRGHKPRKPAAFLNIWGICVSALEFLKSSWRISRSAQGFPSLSEVIKSVTLYGALPAPATAEALLPCRIYANAKRKKKEMRKAFTCARPSVCLLGGWISHISYG